MKFLKVQVRDPVWNQASTQVMDQFDRVLNQVFIQVRDPIATQVWMQVHVQIRTQVWEHSTDVSQSSS